MWRTGLVALRHVGSSRTRDRTHVPCIGRWILFFCFFWLCWVFVSVRGLSLVAASGGHSSSLCAGLSLSRALLLQSTGSRHTGSVVVAHGPTCSVACGIFPDQGSNPCPLHWQADSQPLRHQGSPSRWILNHCATREVQIRFFFLIIGIGKGKTKLLFKDDIVVHGRSKEIYTLLELK